MKPKVVLRIYLAPSGQWAGKIFADDEELAGVNGCSSPEEVKEAAEKIGYFFERVEIV
jgi:hypothetical protein